MDTQEIQVMNMLLTKVAKFQEQAYAVLSKKELQETILVIDDLSQRIQALEQSNTLLSILKPEKGDVHAAN